MEIKSVGDSVVCEKRREFGFYAGLSDVPDSFGLGRPLPAKKRGAVRKVRGPKNYPLKEPRARWAPCGCGAPVAAPAK